MNTAHYPSLELCKKLTEIGFPSTEVDMEIDWIIEWNWNWWELRCPNTMEMIDTLPSSVVKDWEPSLYHLSLGKDYVKYSVLYYEDEEFLVSFGWALPDSLASMYIWLHENNLLPNK